MNSSQSLTLRSMTLATFTCGAGADDAACGWHPVSNAAIRISEPIGGRNVRKRGLNRVAVGVVCVQA